MSKTNDSLSYGNFSARSRGAPLKNQPAPRRRHPLRAFIMLIILAAVVLGGMYHSKLSSMLAAQPAKLKSQSTQGNKPPTPKDNATAPLATANACEGNSLPQLALVSISARHMWACDYSTVVYDSPVVTGMSYLAADLTPVGTYHIFAKETDLYLTGTDSTGSWNDYVNYWMPWLTNKYGTYGFHDATWRTPGDFGNISPDSPNASHGCVELPLATAKWLYGWTQIGTTVQIEA